MPLHNYKCYFNRNILGQKREVLGVQLVGTKYLWAESEEMAIKIAECIDNHDSKEWNTSIGQYDFIDVSLVPEKLTA